MMTSSLFIGLIAATAFSSLSSAQTVLRFSNWLPPTHPITTQILQPWAADIEKNSDGRIKIQFTSASEAYEMLSRGVVDGAMFNADSVDSFRLLPLMKNAYQVPGGLYRDTRCVTPGSSA